MDHPEHTTPKGLSALKPVDVEKMLLGYWHQERIRAKERCELLQAIGTSVYNNEGCFSSIFFYKTRSPRHVKDVDALMELTIRAAGKTNVNLDSDLKVAMHMADDRSEERRVGTECRSRWSPYH